jgi:hypothetical protein
MYWEREFLDEEGHGVPANAGQPWQPIDVEELKLSMERGDDVSEIAASLCRREDEVQAKASELGLTLSPKRLDPKPVDDAPEGDPDLESYRNAWQALRMIREAVETLGPPGVLPSPEAVLKLYGPEPVHEGQAIVDALRKILPRSRSRSG